MVLVLNGVMQDETVCPKDSNSLFLQHPNYRATATQLVGIPMKTISTNPQIGLLYIHQREMGSVAPHDKHVNLIGSDDATTCIIAVVKVSVNNGVDQVPDQLSVLITCIVLSRLLFRVLAYGVRCHCISASRWFRC